LRLGNKKNKNSINATDSIGFIGVTFLLIASF